MQPWCCVNNSGMALHENDAMNFYSLCGTRLLQTIHGAPQRIYAAPQTIHCAAQVELHKIYRQNHSTIVYLSIVA